MIYHSKLENARTGSKDIVHARKCQADTTAIDGKTMSYSTYAI